MKKKLILFIFTLIFTGLTIACDIPEEHEKSISEDGRLEIIHDFDSENLNNTRNIRVYLPESYATTCKKYPVLYMHDGQNIFTPGGTYGCWFVEDTYNELVKNGLINEIIIVCIDNTVDRTVEYNYGNFYDTGGNSHVGNVENYAKFVINEVRPYINYYYRTKKGSKNTAMLGASYAGMASLYFALNHSNVFGKVACMSSTLRYLNTQDNTWYNKDLFNEIKNIDKMNNVKLWLYAGDREKIDPDSNGIYNYAEWTYDLAQTMFEKGLKNEKDLLFEIGQGGLHSETTWAEYVGKPIQYFFGKENYFKPTNLQVRTTVSEMDLDATVKDNYMLAKVTYSNGLSAEVPAALLQVESNQSELFTINRGIITLNYNEILAPFTMDLNVSYENVKSSTSIDIVQTISKEIAVNFEVTTPANSGQTIYMVGNFSNWRFVDDYQLTLDSSVNGQNIYKGTAIFEKGQLLNFKFCASAGWNFEELTSEGDPASNRTYEVSADNYNYFGTVDLWREVP